MRLGRSVHLGKMMWSLPLNMESVLWSRQLIRSSDLLNWGWSRVGRKVREVRKDAKGESTGEKRRVSPHTGPEAPKGHFEEGESVPTGSMGNVSLSSPPLCAQYYPCSGLRYVSPGCSKSLLTHCFSDFNVRTDCLGVLIKCRF